MIFISFFHWQPRHKSTNKTFGFFRRNRWIFLLDVSAVRKSSNSAKSNVIEESWKSTSFPGDCNFWSCYRVSGEFLHRSSSFCSLRELWSNEIRANWCDWPADALFRHGRFWTYQVFCWHFCCRVKNKNFCINSKCYIISVTLLGYLQPA